MVKGVENWAEISGVVQEVREAEIEGHLSVGILVNDVSSFQSFPNFFEDEAGKVIEVNVPRDVAEAAALQPGAVVSCRVRKGGLTSVFAHPEHVERMDS